MQLVQRWIVALKARLRRDARLRGRRFFSLAELNAAIRELLDRFNGKVIPPAAGSRGTATC